MAAEDQPDAWAPCQPLSCRDKEYALPLPLDVDLEEVLTKAHGVLAAERLPFVAQASAFAPMPISEHPLRGRTLGVYRRHQFGDTGRKCSCLFCLQRRDPGQKIRRVPVGKQQGPLITILRRDVGASAALHGRRHRCTRCLGRSGLADMAATQLLAFAVALMMQG